MQSNFFCVFNGNSNLGEFSYCEDGSLLFSSNNCGDYAVLPAGNWQFELMVDSKTGICKCLQGSLAQIKYKKVELNLPISQKGELFFITEEELKPAFGCHYLPFEDEIYYDNDKGIICIGAKDAVGDAIEFASNTIAVVNNGQLLAIYLNLQDVLFESKKIEIKAPLYRGFLEVIVGCAIGMPLLCFIVFMDLLSIEHAVDDFYLSLAFGGVAYLFLLICFVLLTVYYFTSKTKIVISKDEVALYRRNIKKKSIMTNEIAKILSAGLSTWYGYCVCSKNKTKIRFSAKRSIIKEIENLIGYEIPYVPKNDTETKEHGE